MNISPSTNSRSNSTQDFNGVEMTAEALAKMFVRVSTM